MNHITIITYYDGAWKKMVVLNNPYSEEEFLKAVEWSKQQSLSYEKKFKDVKYHTFIEGKTSHFVI